MSIRSSVPKKSAPDPQAVERAIYQVTLPLAIARGLLAVASKDACRTVLYKSVCVTQKADTTILVSTDAHVMFQAISPVKIDMPGGCYVHEIPPASSGGAGKMLLSKLDMPPVNWQRVVPEKSALRPAGTFQNTPPGLFYGSRQGCLRLTEGACFDYRKLSLLCPTDYTVCAKEVSGSFIYTFDGCLDGWTLKYIVMGMSIPDGPLGDKQ